MEFERSFNIKIDDSIFLKVYTVGELKNDLIIFHHGAGYTAQTFLQLISVLRKSLPSVCFAAFDMRGHGQSDQSTDFGFDSLLKDAGKVIESFLSDDRNEKIDVFLIGHSLGASILAALPNNFNNPLVRFSGLIMIDIIEETAINSLSRMPGIIQDIPKSFKDLKIALKWTISSPHCHHNSQAASKQISGIENSLKSQLKLNNETGFYEWITDLSLMKSFWDSWFKGLTNNFLKFPGSRLLILADTDYMDKEMIVAQMQGKFQLSIIRESGHAIQEDRPEELAENINGMIRKHLKLSQILRNK